MDEALVAGGIVIGCIFGILFGALAMSWDANKLIEQCELNLPRTQTCVLNAIPAPEQKP